MVTYKTLIVLPDGTELFSGTGRTDNIRSVSITKATNSGTDLMLGSVCSAMLEAKIQSPDGSLSIATGAVITVYKVGDDGTRQKIGLFNVETPTKVSANIYKIVAYDNVRLLDKDLTEWVRGLTDWPYSITTFANLIAKQCGIDSVLTSHTTESEWFDIYQFDVEDGTTGRQLMNWLAEICGSYCIADSSGKLRFNWYSYYTAYLYPSDLPGEHQTEQLYYQNTFSYEDYEVEEVDAVLMREDNGASTTLWPSTEAENPYIIAGNRILTSSPDYLNGDSWSILEAIKTKFNGRKFVPFKVTIPETRSVDVGGCVNITDGKGNVIKSYITNLVWTGHKMVLECTGNRVRDNSATSMTDQQIKDYSDTAIERTEQDVLYDKLASDAAGLHHEDGEFYADPSFVRGNMVSDLSLARYYSSTDKDSEANFEAWLDEQLAGMAELTVKDIGFTAYPVIPNGNTICARLYKFSDKYASLLGFAYSVPTLYHKAKKNGVWSATVSGSIVQTASIEEVST